MPAGKVALGIVACWVMTNFPGFSAATTNWSAAAGVELHQAQWTDKANAQSMRDKKRFISTPPLNKDLTY